MASTPPRRSRPPRYSIELPGEERARDREANVRPIEASRGGSIHYFQHSGSELRVLLQRAAEWNLDYVESYVPWRVHEIAVGRFDFSSLFFFLETCAELGLKAFLRPGPHCNAELTQFGLPERVVNDPACRARGPGGQHVVQYWPPLMFAVPSYASDVFLGETDRWLRAFREAIAPYITRGLVLAIQIDNEGAYYFRDGVLEQDYHPDALAKFADFLAEKYRGDVARLSRAYEKNVRNFTEVEAPRSLSAQTPSELLRVLDWAQFQEWLYERAWRQFASIFRELPVTANLPLGEHSSTLRTPFFAQQGAAIGLDLYHRRAEFETVRDRVLLACGSADRVFGSEVGVGAPFWWKAVTFEDAMFTLQTAVAYGLAGLNLYMFADRDRWHGGLHDAHGNEHPEATKMREWFSQLTSAGWPWPSGFARDVHVALVLPRSYARLRRVANAFGIFSPVALEAVSGVKNLGVSAERFGFSDAIQIEAYRWLKNAQRVLEAQQVPYVWIDGDAAAARLERSKLILIPTFEFLDASLLETLESAQKRGAKVVSGPLVPTRNEYLEQVVVHSLRSTYSVDRIAAALPGFLHEVIRDTTWPSCDDARCSVTEWRHEDGRVALFVINRTDELVQTSVKLMFSLSPASVLPHGVHRADEDNVLSVLLRPHQVHVLALHHAHHNAAQHGAA